MLSLLFKPIAPFLYKGYVKVIPINNFKIFEYIISEDMLH